MMLLLRLQQLLLLLLMELQLELLLLAGLKLAHGNGMLMIGQNGSSNGGISIAFLAAKRRFGIKFLHGH